MWSCSNFSFFLLFAGIKYLWIQVSQQFLNKIKTVLCSLERKFPEVSKIYPIFFTFSLIWALKSIERKILLFKWHFVVAIIGLQIAWEVYFIKWTTPGDHPVGLRSPQDSKWSHSEVILYIAHWLPPCRVCCRQGETRARLITLNPDWIDKN